MRLLVWSGFYWPYLGGAEVNSAKLIGALRQRGYEIAVVTSHGDLDLPDQDTHEGVPINRIPFLSAIRNRDPEAFFSARQKAAKLKSSFAPDVIHVNFTDPTGLFHLLTTAAHPAPFVTAAHSIVNPEGADGTLAVRLFKEAARVVAVSGAVRERVAAIAPDTLNSLSIIYNGLKTPALAPAPRPLNPPRLLCLGRLIDAKGFDVALAAFAGLLSRFPEARLTIAGNGPELTDLKARAHDLGVSDAVDFPGRVSPSQVPELINSSTLVVVPSRRESFGLVAAEAAQMARPVVASRIDGLVEVVADRETGLLVSMDDAGGFRDAIAGLLENAEMADRMGEMARRRIQEKFSFDQQVDAYDALYRVILEEADRARNT
jgi:glycosyltransferase involved in cell wall biosynthesis